MNMKNLKFVTRLVIWMIVCSFIVSLMTFPLSAASGTIYESESNNTYSTADRTYDDYSSYGTISSTSDVDWWTIRFTKEGIANFWLGNIPSGCNYDLQIYDYTGTKKLVESLKDSNQQELTKIHVRAGEDYYIKITSCSGYSTSKYLFRVKRYDLQDAKVFTSTHSAFSSRVVAKKALPKLWGMGFGGQEYADSRVQSAYNAFPKTDIYTMSALAFDAGIYLYEGYVLGAGPGPDYPAGSLYISSYAKNELENVKLALFPGTYSGYPYMDLNLVDKVLEKGAFNCIGFFNEITPNDAAAWTEKFYDYCMNGQNLGNALILTNKWARNPQDSPELISRNTIVSQYYGSSRLYATLLG